MATAQVAPAPEPVAAMPVRLVLLRSLLAAVSLVAAACPAAPAPGAAPAVPDDAPPLPVVTADATTLLFSFVDAAGRMQAVPSVNDVPEAVRGRVLVVDLARTPEERQAHRYAFFADLTSTRADGTHPVVVVSRYDAAKGNGGAAPPSLPPSDGSVVLYTAEWCGYCKKAKAWMQQNHVTVVERDVEKAPGAQAELQAKLKAAGIPGGGIPVVDWAGTMVMGFDVAAFEKLLKEKPPTPPTAPADGAE